MDYLIEENPWIPSVVADASKHRIYAHRGQSVLVEFAAEGSIVITCIASALALWILKKTLGETIKEAWLTSPLHHHLKEFLSRDRIPRTQQIAQRLKPRIRGSRRLEELPLSVTVEVSEARVPVCEHLQQKLWIDPVWLRNAGRRTLFFPMRATDSQSRKKTKSNTKYTAARILVM